MYSCAAAAASGFVILSGWVHSSIMPCACTFAGGSPERQEDGFHRCAGHQTAGPDGQSLCIPAGPATVPAPHGFSNKRLPDAVRMLTMSITPARGADAVPEWVTTE